MADDVSLVGHQGQSILRLPAVLSCQCPGGVQHAGCAALHVNLQPACMRPAAELIKQPMSPAAHIIPTGSEPR